ncbi:flagellar basal body P-ring formation chaperone FlgA [Meridianimarinicoccus roseus]|uniref:flagellar basal body P-ring formation chaperone FlgA n=1 Tax=Meridianimarinicoccus roseus TaxID=2072018 RepID=UPI001EE64360|nr:flagellar basal body P-ring formation chaperone FlgA [Meridianimarinicoccus roseus]
MRPPRFLTAALLCALATPGQTAPGFPAGLGGDDVIALVTAALAKEGLSARPEIASARRYPACGSAPAVSPRNGDWSTVELSCAGPAPWSRAVRTGLPAAPVMAEPAPQTPQGPLVATLVGPLAAGAVIGPDDIALAPAAVGTGTGAFGRIDALVGRRLATNLGAGHVVLARHLERDWVVTRGKPVAIAFEGGIVSVTAPGIALQDGQQGDLIDIENRASGRVIKGYVAGPNKISVHAKLN